MCHSACQQPRRQRDEMQVLGDQREERKAPVADSTDPVERLEIPSRLCPLGVPSEVMARRGPAGRMVPPLSGRTKPLRIRRQHRRQPTHEELAIAGPTRTGSIA
jgi:hypothetical protein